MSHPYLHIHGVRKNYGAVVATDHVELSVDEGEFMTFLGPSGSGKSTTLYILAGFEDPTKGDILLNGQTLLKTPSHKRNIGMVFQRYTLFPHLSVSENVAFPLRVRRMNQSDITDKVRRALALVRLDSLGDRMPAHLSGGQQQRVALARALVYDPPVLLMDEPLSALDKKLREELQHEIRRIHQETSVTILYVTHDQEEALRLSDKIAIFNEGRIEQVGTGQELYAQPSTRFVADFIGDSAFLHGTISSVGDLTVSLRFEDGTKINSVAVHGEARVGQRVELMLRPERISVARDTKTAGRSIAVSVVDWSFLGNSTSVSLRTKWGEPLTARLNFGHPLAGNLSKGEQLYVECSADAAHAFPLGTHP